MFLRRESLCCEMPAMVSNWVMDPFRMFCGSLQKVSENREGILMSPINGLFSCSVNQIVKPRNTSEAVLGRQYGPSPSIQPEKLGQYGPSPSICSFSGCIDGLGPY